MVHITSLLSKKKIKVPFSVEIMPPDKGFGIYTIDKIINKIITFNPVFVSVTYHTSYFDFIEENNRIRKVYRRKRPGTLGVCAALKYRYDLETVPHVLCGGFSAPATEDYLVELDYLGMDNILALRGDASKGHNSFVPRRDGHIYASQLVEQISNMNNGIYIEDVSNPKKTNFCIGVAGYPEKHYESPNFERDIENLAKKIDAGADYIITQMFFDNFIYFDFVDRARDAGITVPIIPGLKNISSVHQLNKIPKTFHVTIPSDLVSKIESATNENMRSIAGADWLLNQARDLMDNNVPSLHFYVLNRTQPIIKILEELYILNK